MKHEIELEAVEVVPSLVINEVVFTADPELDAAITKHQSYLKRRAAALLGWLSLRSREARENVAAMGDIMLGEDRCRCTPSRSRFMDRR